MTDRLKGFVVTLDSDIREDDAETIRQAIHSLRHVVSVQPVKTNLDDQINREKIRLEINEKIFAVLKEKT